MLREILPFLEPLIRQIDSIFKPIFGWIGDAYGVPPIFIGIGLLIVALKLVKKAASLAIFLLSVASILIVAGVITL